MKKSSESALNVNSTIRIHGRNRDEFYRSAERAVAQIEMIMGTVESDRDRDGITESQAAFRQFMAALQAAIEEVGPAVEVSQTVGWVKIESMRNGHKVYVSKGKLAVGRIDSTLPPGLVTGSQKPGRYNGRIASWLPADTGAVAEAIRLLADSSLKPLR